jgi:hypothetical protein
MGMLLLEQDILGKVWESSSFKQCDNSVKEQRMLKRVSAFSGAITWKEEVS